MSSYVLLERIQVQGANAISGLTYGYPAPTQFLGLTHALTRQLKQKIPFGFDGCAIISHKHHLKTHTTYGRQNFVQLKSPPSTLMGKGSDANKTAPIIEEGKMDLTVSLLLACEQDFSTRDDAQNELINALKASLPMLRLAGGRITQWKKIHLLNQTENLNTELKKILMPAYVLLDRSEHILSNADHGHNVFERWMACFGIHYQCKGGDADSEINKSQKIQWERVPKPPAWLVPLALGYKSISPVFEAGQVANTRDVTTPFVFAEMAYGVGQWQGVHRLDNIQDAIWRYKQQSQWYLCQQTNSSDEQLGEDDDNEPQ